MAEQDPLPAVRVGSWAMVVLPGEIDMSCAPAVGAELGAVLAEEVSVLVVDMSATTFCDSAGVRMLVAAHRQAEAAGAQVRLAVPSVAVRRVFELLEVDRVLSVFDTLDEAMADAPGGAAGGSSRAGERPGAGGQRGERPGAGRGLAAGPG